MSEQIGISGCFGNPTPYPIDDIEEVEVAVDEIVETPTSTEDVTSDTPNLALAQLVGQYAQRVRLLTWAVIAISLVLLLKETKN